MVKGPTLCREILCTSVVVGQLFVIDLQSFQKEWQNTLYLFSKIMNGVLRKDQHLHQSLQPAFHSQNMQNKLHECDCVCVYNLTVVHLFDLFKFFYV